jgi:hypothetical protein
MPKRGLGLKVHHYVRHPEKGDVLERITPYIRLTEGDEKIFLQNGQVYWEEGDPVPRKEWPVWLPDRLMSLSPEAVEETGFTAVIQNMNARTAPERKVAPRVPRE